ncbi:ATP-dependent DNA helicase MER3 homolog [Papilio machaon]|uniref:ATP-dependent DNA helicase MER3 homolog n=1 Tax=Papilio machaon TaxID=76193 RepID=UPI001E665BCD|nr:ATP-dependent DNA helicase MER3 homolog [Papilio machaon]
MTSLQSFTDILDEEIDNSPPFSLPTLGTSNSDDQNVVNNVNISNKGLNRPPKHTGERQGLRSVEEIDPKYRDVFSFQHFNVVQTKVIEDALYSDKSLVVCAPTGSGKTVIFEMAIVQLLMEMEEKNIDEDFKIIYMAPIKAICTERLTEWSPKFSKFNSLCIEVTGDTDVDFSQLKPYRIIITTPEKWDMLTRRWRDYRGMVEVIKLFLIDEVHILNDVTRGPVLEAVVSRMKTIQSSIQSTYRIEQLQKQKQGNINIAQIEANAPKIRFVAVSATISNPEDVAEWLGTTNKTAVFYKFGDECRPVKIKRVVEGYPCPVGTSIFKFDITLNYKLWPIIQRYHDKKPTLIFCNTRKGVILTAEALSREITLRFSEEQKAKLTALASAIKTKKIQSLVMCGIGCHHAGLLFEERVNIERAFRNSDLPILITTTTLAMGVNLPAHLVIIKNTQQYVNGTYQEYSISTVLQMIGRAGRPQFDSEATAVIMTRLADKARYQALVGGCEPLQSYLHKRLAENLNSEVALGTVTDLAQCVQWVRSTFFFVRAARDPKMYLGLPKSAPTDLISKKIEELCMKAVNGLESSGLITKDEVCCIQSTEAGRLLSIYYLDLETMKRIMKIKGDESLEQLLWVVCESHELSDMHLRVDERRCLNALNRNNTAPTIRFPMKGKINTRQMKLNCIIQAVLGCLPIHEPSLNQEAIMIMRIAVRICKCLVSYVTRPNALRTSLQNYQAILNAIVLAKCMESQLWENSKYVSKQLKGIGPTYSTLLASAGKINFMLLEESHPRDLERIMNKGPPAGNVLRKQISLLPKYQLTITPIDENSLKIQLTLLNQMYLAENLDQLTAGANHTSYIIIGDSENYLLILASVKDKDLITIHNGEITYQTVRRHQFEHKIMAHCISSNFAGIDVHCEYLFQELDFGSKDIIPISQIEKTDGKNIKQTAITDTFKIRKRKNHDPVDTNVVEKKKCDFAIIEQIKSFTQSHNKLRNEIEKEDDEQINEILNKIDKEILQQDRPNFNIPQNQVPVVSNTRGNKTYDSEVRTTKNRISGSNKEEDDEQINEILNKIDKEILQQDRPNFNIPQNQVPVVSNTRGNKTYDSEVRTTKNRISGSNKEEDDEQINEILNKIDKEILQQDRPNFNIPQNQVPVVSNTRGNKTYDSEVRTTKNRISGSNKEEDDEQINEILNKIDKEILQQDKPKYDITEKQKKANNMTETENREIDEQSTFVNTVKNHIDEYLEKAKQSSKVAEKQVLQLVEISPNKTITKSLCKKKTDAKQNIVSSDKGLSETNFQKNVYLTDKNIDDTLNDNENENNVSIYENKENIEEFKLPQIQKEDLDYAIASKISNVNKTNSVISLRKNKPSLNHYDINGLESKRLKEGYSNYTNTRCIWKTSDIDKTIPNHENERNISKDFFLLEELQNEHENDTISNAVTNIYSKDHEVLDHENKSSNNNSIDYDHIKSSEKSEPISNLENLKHNTTKDYQFNNKKTMEIYYSDYYDESNKALVPMLSSNDANNVYENRKHSPNSTLEQAAEKMEEKEMLLDSKNYGSSSPSVIKNNISFQPYFNKVLDKTVSFGCEYMKKFSFTKTQVNVCTKSNTEDNYCIISKVQIDLDIIKNQSTIEKGNFTPIEEKLPNILVDNKLNGDQNNLENSKILIEETGCKNDIVKREQTNNIHNKQKSLSTIQSKFKESPQTSIQLKEQCDKTYMEQYYSVPKTCHTVKDIINKYQKLASRKFYESDAEGRYTPSSTYNKNTSNVKNEKVKRPFRIKDLDKHYKPKTQNTNIQPPPELDHSKLMAKIFESIKDSTETNKHELEVNKLIDEPDIEYTRNKNFNDLESPDLGSPDLESTDLESPIIDDESPSFEKTDLLNNDLDISQSMLNPKSLLESLAQNDIILPPLQFRDEAKRNSPVFDIDLNDFNLTNVDKINLDDAFKKDDNTSSTASEIETWTMSKDDETWSNISKSTTAEVNIPRRGGYITRDSPEIKA